MYYLLSEIHSYTLPSVRSNVDALMEAGPRIEDEPRNRGQGSQLFVLIEAGGLYSRIYGTFKSRLHKHWLDQDVLYNFHSELTGNGGASICM